MMRAIAIVLITLLAACATTTAPIVNSSSEIRLFGVSSLPPQNGSWRALISSVQQASLGQVGAKDSESLVANVSIYTLPNLDNDEALLNYVTKMQMAGSDIGRFEKLKSTHALAELGGASCVSYHLISKDMSARIRNGGTATMLLENRGYHCQHPKNPAIGVNIEYSLRHYPDTDYQTFATDAENFFTNVEFTEF